jgi:hypothetical protein
MQRAPAKLELISPFENSIERRNYEWQIAGNAARLRRHRRRLGFLWKRKALYSLMRFFHQVACSACNTHYTRLLERVKNALFNYVRLQ